MSLFPGFEDIDNEKIESFSETPADEPKKKELDKAEQETKKEDKETKEELDEKEEEQQEEEASEELSEEDKSDSEGGDASDEVEADGLPSEEKLAEMHWYDIYNLRFTRRMEYETPSGVDSIHNGCPSCNDAGDAAIIDAEITPAKSTNPEGDTDDLGGDMGDMGGETAPDLGEGDNTEEMDFGMELRTYAECSKQLEIAKQRVSKIYDPILSMESLIVDLIKSLYGALKAIITKVGKFTRNTYVFARNKISKIFLKQSTIHKLWKFKLWRNLEKLDQDKLAGYEIESFPLDTWIATAKISLMAYEIVKSVDKIVFDPGTTAVTNSIQAFKQKLEHVGIDINLTKNRIIMDDLLDKRRRGSILDLGFTKTVLENCMRYMGDISRRVPNGEDNDLQPSTDKVIKKIGEKAQAINSAVAEGRLAKGSKEYQAETDKLLNYTVRFDFCLTCMKCAYICFEMLTNDLYKVLEKYEDAFDDIKD